MEREEQFATCLLMVGPPPEHSTLQLHQEVSTCLQESQAWRGKVRQWYHTHVLKERFPIFIEGSYKGWREWIGEYLTFLRRKRDEAVQE